MTVKLAALTKVPLGVVRVRGPEAVPSITKAVRVDEVGLRGSCETLEIVTAETAEKSVSESKIGVPMGPLVELKARLAKTGRHFAARFIALDESKLETATCRSCDVVKSADALRR